MELILVFLVSGILISTVNDSYYSAATETEPGCSKFPYEHDMLSKMVNIEIKLKNMENEMNNQREKMEKFAKDYHSMRDILVVVLENKTAEFARAMERIHSILKFKQIVAFSAKMRSKLVGPVALGQPFIFESVDTNIGNAYNNETGQFVAPVSGTYVFYCSILSKVGDAFWASVSVNGSIKARLYEGVRGIAGEHGSASQAVVVELISNDIVAVNSEINGEFAVGETYSTFSGFLLHPLV